MLADKDAVAKLSAENLQLRLSGGSTNVEPTASLGGVMSTVTTAGTTTVTADFIANDFVAADYRTQNEQVSTGNTGIITTRLLDDVTKVQAETGDPEGDYRCFYLYNTHQTLTMYDLKIWIHQNTPADDVVEIGLGNATINNTESTITNENTAPSPAIAFSVAPTEQDALYVGDLPPLGRKSIWVRRTVPAAASSPHLSNSYQLKVKFFSSDES